MVNVEQVVEREEDVKYGVKEVKKGIHSSAGVVSQAEKVAGRVVAAVVGRGVAPGKAAAVRNGAGGTGVGVVGNGRGRRRENHHRYLNWGRCLRENKGVVGCGVVGKGMGGTRDGMTGVQDFLDRTLNDYRRQLHFDLVTICKKNLSEISK